MKQNSSAARSAALARVDLAVPTLLVAAAATIAFVAASLAALFEVLPLWLAAIVSTVAAFVAFTPLHDAAHQSISRHRWVNELVGRLCALPLLGPFTAVRYVHLEHHKHTNDPDRDPDHHSGRGPAWQLPLRWLTQDLNYYRIYFAVLGKRPAAERRETIVTLVTTYGLIATAIVAGYGLEVLCLWLIPARLATALLAFSFDYLPHRPHDVRAKDDRYQATAIIADEWLIPLFLYQNYHLIHHLYPGVPFYRYGLVWREREEELRARGAKIVRLTASWPTMPPADQRSAV